MKRIYTLIPPWRWKTAARLLALLGLALAASAAWAGAPIELSPADAGGKWGPSLKADAERALGRAESRLGLNLDEAVEILSLPDDSEFYAFVEERLPQVVAVARASRCQIVINRRAWFAEGPQRQQQIMVHEMAHLLLGRNIKGRLPAWLDEGLAMLTAGEGDYESDLRVLVAGTLGTLIPLQRLMDRVTIGVGSQEQAYAQSLALTRYFIRNECPGEDGNNPAPLVRRLTDPELGERRVKRLWDPVAIGSLEHQWRQSWHTIWSMMMFLSGTTVLWMFISLLFLVAWWRKRMLARAARERFAAEEQWDAEFGEAAPYWLHGSDAVEEEDDETPEWEKDRDDEDQRHQKRPWS